MPNIGFETPEVSKMKASIQRAQAFYERFGLSAPILLAPMAGASAPSLSIAVANAGGLGACGVLLMQPDEIRAWSNEVRSKSNGKFQLNVWIPDDAPVRDRARETAVREFLVHWGPPVPPEAGDALLPVFADQCEAMLEVAPPILSSVMGLFPAPFVKRMKDRGIHWFATVSTVGEAKAAEAAGADVIVAQGAEAGGHRASFEPGEAETKLVGMFSLLPAVVDAVRLPVVATGGIADARALAAALTLGASAVQIGTGFLRCPESAIHPAWSEALSRAAPEDTMLTRAFSGRAGRSIATEYVRAAAGDAAPAPAPYPVQRGLTAVMRASGTKDGDLRRMQLWAGQSASMARKEPAAVVLSTMWDSALALLA